MGAQSTPGPWHVEPVCDEDDQQYWSDNWGCKVCRVCRPDTARYDSTVVDWINEGDAHLIAAAPDLLAALIGLKSILDTAESNASGNPEWEAVSARVNAARAAIRKAQGEA